MSGRTVSFLDWIEQALDEAVNAGTAAWDRGTVVRADHRQWAQARRLQDLCDLTCKWLQGEILSQPGYYGPVDVDVDADVAPMLPVALIEANRAGFLTRVSQAGYDGDAHAQDDGWLLHAAVDGLALPATVRRLHQVLADTRFGIQTLAVGTRRALGEEAIPVTFLRGEARTWFGGYLTKKHVRWDLCGSGRAAIKEATSAMHVLIWDPEPGKNDLWPVLRMACALPEPAGTQTVAGICAETRSSTSLQASTGITASDAQGGDQNR